MFQSPMVLILVYIRALLASHHHHESIGSVIVKFLALYNQCCILVSLLASVNHLEDSLKAHVYNTQV